MTVSPNVDIDLGGAYVFDDSMKKNLVDDITNKIVDEIESTVRRAVNNQNYGFGA